MPERDTSLRSSEARQRAEAAPNREATLAQAVRLLLDALDGCAGDDPNLTCPRYSYHLQSERFIVVALTPDRVHSLCDCFGYLGVHELLRGHVPDR